MKAKNLIRLFVAAAILAISFAITPITADAAGWGKNGEQWYYENEDGKRLTNAWHYDSVTPIWLLVYRI